MNPFASGRVTKIPRRWSNAELRQFAGGFAGAIVNVSGWRDEDKEGAHYADYFPKQTSYTITNYKAEARGFQGKPGEVFLDLAGELPAELRDRFDLVFNHTVLEHIYDFHTAFSNLCRMSRDLVIVVLPWLQPYHSDYGDFWRFSPQATQRMYEANGLTPLYLSFNEHPFTSVYVFAIGSKHPDRWRAQFPDPISMQNAAGRTAGARAIVQGPRAVVRMLRGK